MRSVEEASNAMALDGIIFEVLGLSLTIFISIFYAQNKFTVQNSFLICYYCSIREHL